MKTLLVFAVDLNGKKTDAESIGAAMDNVVKAGLATLDDCWGEYGGPPQVKPCRVVDPAKVMLQREDLETLMDDQDDNLGKYLANVRDTLKQLLG